MNDLFIKQTQFTKVAYDQASRASTDWTKDVLESFYNQFPIFTNTAVRVEWKKKDEDKGYGLGIIIVERGQGLTIPIIIEQLNIYPFDTAFIGEAVMPLTEWNIQEFASGKSAFQRTVPKDSGDISDALFNPSFSQVIYPNYKVASFIEKLQGNITKEAKDHILHTVQNNKSIAEGFKQNKTYEVIEKIASLKEMETVDIKDFISKDLNRDIHYIYKTGRFNYKAIFGNSEVDNPVELELSSSMAEKLPHVKTAKCSCAQLKTAELRKIGTFQVKDRDYKLSIDETGNYVEIPQGLQVTTSKTWDLADKLEPNTEGIFKFGEVVTPVFRVLSVYTEKNKTMIDTFNGLEKTSYVKMYGIQEPYKEKNITYIPIDTQFIKLSHQDKFVDNWLEGKVANRVIKTAEDAYTLNGPVFMKYAEMHRIKDISEHDTKWAMIACRAEQSDIDKLSSLKTGDTYSLKSCLHVPVALEKIAAVVEQQNEENAKAIKVLAVDLIKEAATVPDAPTVDAILSLGFITKDNIAQYIEMIPEYERVCDSLAKLLMTTRIGFKAINEAVLRKTMLGLVEIVNILKGISSLNIKK